MAGVNSPGRQTTIMSNIKERLCPKCGATARFYKTSSIGPRWYAEYKCDNKNTKLHGKRFIFKVRINAAPPMEN